LHATPEWKAKQAERDRKRRLDPGWNARKRAEYAADPERMRGYNRAHYQRNKERERERARRYAQENPDKIREIRNGYNARNRDKVNTEAAARRSANRRAEPAWVDRSEIRAIYAEARRQGLTVDHIIPLRHKAVCGLHVPWNLQLLPHSINSSKRNAFAI
jgi:hypothetical protein